MEKELELLYSRLRKVEERNFDLHSWKQGTIAVLDSILGPGNMKTKLIEEVDFHNSSWSLRDTTGDVDSIKKTCADVLQTIIMEIETFGLAEKDISEKKKERNKEHSIIEEAIRKELSQSQLDELIELIKNKEVTFVDVVDKLKRYGYEVAPRILASLLLLPEFKNSVGK
ncbi:hypothetical protein SAMN06265379_10724 [Saccharicrinis carchari]|uniref:Uncharacterized protein n=1 Tax=Saccharicrinis carchari TaxID=1168039 RepID=A0A521DXX4_SACCC|nr:hypothetical protein [Saccharicrinis carchari]SMO76567.1 hypothetical protein SAMN06265379_10724 [Saccharicrinis carchari]